ncbi:Flp family type IVb pilin [Cryobacterium roopkundense]|uniref:Pilus assembly protein Flp/PilA n=1 Tax=Cryobacterium roopkundense TaxID=1001240 RepID=A0A7W8ZX04_9MICO|nr:Flp family type IVb pilin [Cryobacterium roopkundense]MBB5641505.1 pilus assembly protein Flp/PilA [Cryobacterium roopkundense]
MSGITFPYRPGIHYRRHTERECTMKLFTKAQALINSMRTEDEGATAVEYGLMVSLIAVVIIAAVALIGTNLDAMFDVVGTKIKTTA